MGLSIVRPEEVAGRGELAISVMPLNILLRLVITAEKATPSKLALCWFWRKLFWMILIRPLRTS